MRVGLVLGLTFAAGLAGGVALDRRVLDGGHAAARRAARDRGPVIERFASDLGLTAAQRDSIETILDHYRARMKAIWQDVHPRYSAIVDSARNEIETVLTPDQVQQYRALLEREAHRRDERNGSAAPGGPGHGGGSARRGDSAAGRDSAP
ncbi:MAG TPA: hypothetical protein VKA44_02840 [Gemmatimonadota bacterium]|nr:hypothetical protein [Gemmatimonadota bacterium]